MVFPEQKLLHPVAPFFGKKFSTSWFCLVANYFYCYRILRNLNFFTMRSILYLIAVILIIGWLLGFFVYSAGGLIHILIVLAVISLILGLMRSTP